MGKLEDMKKHSKIKVFLLENLSILGILVAYALFDGISIYFWGETLSQIVAELIGKIL